MDPAFWKGVMDLCASINRSTFIFFRRKYALFCLCAGARVAQYCNLTHCLLSNLLVAFLTLCATRGSAP